MSTLGSLRYRSIFPALAFLTACSGKPDSNLTLRSLAVGTTLFQDDFELENPNRWTVVSGNWSIVRPSGASAEYGSTNAVDSLALAGDTAWGDYTVSAYTRRSAAGGGAALLARVQDATHYYQLELKEDNAGVSKWWLWKNDGGSWTYLASGPYATTVNAYYLLRLEVSGSTLTASASDNYGVNFTPLGAATDISFASGHIGLRSWGVPAYFDMVEVALGDSAGASWGPAVTLRDDTAMWPQGKPAGGWWVTPAHATLLADGRVLFTGWGRTDPVNCAAGNTRRNGTSFVLDPAMLAGATSVNVTPIDEQGDPASDKLYCAGHVPMADGKVLYTGGSRYKNLGMTGEQEWGLNYARLYDPATTTFSRVMNP